MSKYTDKFDQICGRCDGIDMKDVTEEDIRGMAKVWASQGEEVTEEEIDDAIRGLRELQEDDGEDE